MDAKWIQKPFDKTRIKKVFGYYSAAFFSFWSSIDHLEAVKNSPTEIFFEIKYLKVPGKFEENKLLLIVF